MLDVDHEIYAKGLDEVRDACGKGLHVQYHYVLVLLVGDGSVEQIPKWRRVLRSSTDRKADTKWHEDNLTILEKAVILYPDYGTAYAKQLLYTIFKMYMPLIEAELENCRRFLHRVAFKNVDTKIEDLKSKYGNRDAGQWTEQDFISPIVLLLKLANDKGDMSFDQEQNDWGRLWSVRKYLISLNLKEHLAEEEKYWPGMPSCILSIVPVWTSHQIVIPLIYTMLARQQ
jgi:hypothetical protein